MPGSRLEGGRCTATHAGPWMQLARVRLPNSDIAISLPAPEQTKQSSSERSIKWSCASTADAGWTTSSGRPLKGRPTGRAGADFWCPKIGRFAAVGDGGWWRDAVVYQVFRAAFGGNGEGYRRSAAPQ
jgi:hypothetical protein